MEQRTQKQNAGKTGKHDGAAIKAAVNVGPRHVK
jgi:hypothetical protein